MFDRRLILIAACSLLGGCQTMAPHVDVVQPTAVRPQPAPMPQVASGSIYGNANYRPLFEDHRARNVGDTLTITIAEKVSAVQKSTSTIDKTGKAAAAVTGVPLLNSPKLLGRLGAGGSSSTDFAGKSDTENSNDISGSITATVIEVLPNGHLIVSGEKQLGVNENVDVLRFSGQVDPSAIQVGNVVPSTTVANVRLEHRGRGAAAEAQEIGWLGRVFLNVLPF
jgi:flagellar L-ring protein precursor FlgH